MEVIVTIEDGSLKGSQVTSVTGKTYYSFQGIPYAKPPTGELRFRAPQPPEPWTSVRDATKEGAICPQFDFDDNNSYKGDEDCLFVNVYTSQLPSINGDQISLPVMVWIHGGGFYFGSGNRSLSGPDFIIEKDVILVTMNYRLGALGFLDTEDGLVTANCGMRDQVAAMKWVKNNISNFGGNVENITVFGESAGSDSVQLHLLSTMTQGLFNRTISESGSSIAYWSTTSSSRQNAFDLGKVIGLETDDSKKLIEFLRMQDPKKLVEGVAALTSLLGIPDIKFVPSIETQDYGEGTFLSGSPYDLLNNGAFHQIPQIIGTNTAEGIIGLGGILEDPNFLDMFDKNPSLLIPNNLKGDETLAQGIKNFYFGGKSIANDTISNFVDHQTDTFMAYSSNKSVEIYSNNTKAPIYYYLFSFDGILGFAKHGNEHLQDILKGIQGPAHADDLGYIFLKDGSPKVSDDSLEAFVRRIMVELWTNFAKTGNPTPSGSDFEWLPVTPDKQQYLDINPNPKMVNTLVPERMIFWDNIYKTYGNTSNN